MKIRYLILGISLLLVGVIALPNQVQAAGKTTIEYVVTEESDQETIKEIPKEPLESSDSTTKDNRSQKRESIVSNQKASQYGRLPSTNDQKRYGLSLLGLTLCLAVIVWKYRSFSKEVNE